MCIVQLVQFRISHLPIWHIEYWIGSEETSPKNGEVLGVCGGACQAHGKVASSIDRLIIIHRCVVIIEGDQK